MIRKVSDDFIPWLKLSSIVANRFYPARYIGSKNPKLWYHSHFHGTVVHCIDRYCNNLDQYFIVFWLRLLNITIYQLVRDTLFIINDCFHSSISYFNINSMSFLADTSPFLWMKSRGVWSPIS